MIPELAISMLACARIGAVPQRRVRRLQRRGAARPHQRRARRAPRHRRRRLPARPGRAAEGDADEALADTPSIKHVVVVAAAGRRADPRGDGAPAATTGITTLMQHASSRAARPSRWMRRTCSTSSTRPVTTGKPKGIVHTTAGYLVGTYATTNGCSTCARTTCTGAPRTSAG